jgi:hypothetical protein
MIKLSLGTDAKARKALPIMRVLGYFTAALAGLTRHAVRGNAAHNPGEPLHWARGKSGDHAECVGRHSFDLMDIMAWLERNPEHPDRAAVIEMASHEHDARVWRTCADSQEFYEKYLGAPMSPSSVAAPTSADTPGIPAIDKLLGLRVLDPIPPGHIAGVAKSGTDTWRTRVGGPHDPAYRASLDVPAGADWREPQCINGPQLAEPVVLIPDEAAPRCGHMSRTKRVCTRVEGHEGLHYDPVTQWHHGE